MTHRPDHVHADPVVSGMWRGEPARFTSDSLLISVRDNAPLNRTLNDVRRSLAREVRQLRVSRRPGRRWAILHFEPLHDAATRIPELAEQLGARSDLHYAEPDFAGSAHLHPNDPRYHELYWPKKVEIEWLWTHTRGSKRVILGIIDSGISMPLGGMSPDHEDLRGRRFIVRHWTWWGLSHHDYLSYGFASGTPPRDLSGHGTHVAGIAAAAGNNHRGVAGANWYSPVYVARVMGKSDIPTAGRVKLAVNDLLNYAYGPFNRFLNTPGFPFPRFGVPDKRVVINLSLGLLTEADSMRQMCEETSDGNTVLCVAAGSLDKGPSNLDYPAAFAAQFEHVIAVGASNSNDDIVGPLLEDYSGITIFAPGMLILSAVPTGTSTPDGSPYDFANGTSHACPMVSGAVSLLWSHNRLSSPGQIRQQLVNNAHLIEHGGRSYPRLALGNIARGYSFTLWPT